jgi:hypothetical protein
MTNGKSPERIIADVRAALERAGTSFDHLITPRQADAIIAAMMRRRLNDIKANK